MDEMNKDSKAYKCKRYDDMFKAAESTTIADEDWVAYQRDLSKFEEMNAGIIWAAIEARDEGRAEGIAEGIAEGRAEGLRSIVKNLIGKGYSFETIADIIDIPIEEVMGISNSIKK